MERVRKLADEVLRSGPHNGIEAKEQIGCASLEDRIIEVNDRISIGKEKLDFLYYLHTRFSKKATIAEIFMSTSNDLRYDKNQVKSLLKEQEAEGKKEKKVKKVKKGEK